MSGFWDDVSDAGKAFVTGRWTGGENSIGDVWNRDPMAIIAPVGAIAGGAALGAGALGAFGGAEAAGAAGGAELFGAGATAPELTGAFGTAEAAADPWAAFASTGGATEGVATGEGTIAGGAQSLDALAYGGGSPVTGATPPMSLTPGASGAADSGAGSFFSNLGSSLTADPLRTAGVGVAGGFLGYNLLKGNPRGANEQNVANMAGYLNKQIQPLTDTGKQLQSYLLNGNLPGPLQAKVDQIVRSAKAAAISNAAKNGQNTDPRLNTQLESAIREAEMSGLRLAGEMETKMFEQGTAMINEGIKTTALSSQMYQWLANADRMNNDQIQKAIMAFASALGGSRNVTINTGGTRSV